MVMNENFLYIDSKDILIDNIESGDITPSDDLIVFIEDTKEIWTHGSYFDCKNLKELNIATINGQSLTDGGDIEIGSSVETYMSPFSTGILIDVKDGFEEKIEANLDELTQAIKDKKLIIFLSGNRFGGGGASVASAYYNVNRGKTYLTVIAHNGVAIYIKWDDGDTELTAENIEVFDIGDIDYRLGLLEEDIPAAVTESTVSGWGFTKNTGTYSKPSGGIPKSDLASAVQTSLGKADTALQSHQDISGKQDKLVSGTNIKTINGTSILGSGDITISGGGSSSGGSGAYSEVNHGTADTTFALTPNTFHVWDEVASLTLDFGSETTGVANEFLFQFTSGATATSLTLPDGIKWANDTPPTIEPNMIYQMSILKGLASVLEFKNPQISIFYIDGTEYQMDEGMTWEEWVNSKYNITGFYIEYMSWIDTYVVAIGDGFNYGTLPDISISDLILSGYEYEMHYENGSPI